MSKVFEDEFMEWHASMIGLCKELTQERVDMIYVYCCMEEDEKMFDAFFLKDGKAVHAGDLKIPAATQKRFLALGMEDMAQIEQVCKKHGRPSPTEIKMVYNVSTRGLETSYRYEEYLDAEDKCAEDIYEEWMEKVNEEQKQAPATKKSGFRFPFFGKRDK